MRVAHGLAVLVLLVALAATLGCDRIQEALDDIRRSTGEQWERGGRRLP